MPTAITSHIFHPFEIDVTHCGSRSISTAVRQCSRSRVICRVNSLRAASALVGIVAGDAECFGVGEGKEHSLNPLCDAVGSTALRVIFEVDLVGKILVAISRAINGTISSLRRLPTAKPA